MALTIDGLVGATWATWDTPERPFEDEFRGLAALPDDTAVVISLGANDALLTALSPVDAKAANRDRVDGAMASMLDLALLRPRCIVVVTPPDRPVLDFGVGADYSSESVRLTETLATLARARPQVRVADFATLSRPHHLGDADPDDWFTGVDELHPNVAGTEAWLGLALDTVEHCPR